MQCDAMQWNVRIDAYMVVEVIASPRFKVAKLNHLFWETFMTHCHIILQISADGKVDYWAVGQFTLSVQRAGGSFPTKKQQHATAQMIDSKQNEFWVLSNLDL